MRFNMEYDNKSLEMIRELSDAFGPSGFEDDVTNVIRKYADGLGGITEDKMRNLYIYRKENKGGRPVIMLDAHSDEVGFMVHSIKPNGTLRFVALGSWNRACFSSADVLIKNEQGKEIPGVIAAKPVHFMTQEERTAGGIPEISGFIIDIGARSYDEAVNDFGIRIGDPVVPASRFQFDREHDLMFGKAFDCRIGVASMIEALRRLEGVELPCDIIAAASTQEELGERGCRVAVNHVKPDIAIAFEGCPADDTFTEPYAIQTALKKGPMLRRMDRSVICSPRFQRFAVDKASEKNLSYQVAVREGGGNDGAVINNALEGVPVIVAGVPVRYIHSMNCITSYFDFDATTKLAVELLRSIDESVIDSF